MCLDVINQTWSPMFGKKDDRKLCGLREGLMRFVVLAVICSRLCFADLVNIFDVFLPQLLRYPNPSDPLNGEAAVMLLRDPEAYSARVRGQ